MDLPTIWTGLTTIGAVLFAYLYYRRREIVDLTMEIIDAYSDSEVTEEEFDQIIEKAKKVLYKK